MLCMLQIHLLGQFSLQGAFEMLGIGVSITLYLRTMGYTFSYVNCKAIFKKPYL